MIYGKRQGVGDLRGHMPRIVNWLDTLVNWLSGMVNMVGGRVRMVSRVRVSRVGRVGEMEVTRCIDRMNKASIVNRINRCGY